uniref:TASOR pseudo-PARP domain-containing protein n=1 Tax=Latimeria chalumnae TaxID=7897 RepID=H3AUB9_LATCH
MKKNRNNANGNSVLPTVFYQQLQPDSSQFTEKILPILQHSYLDPASQECFQYNSAVLVKNSTLLKEYNTFHSQKKKKGYSPEELERSFAFLLFESESQVKTVCQSGLNVGNSNISTLGNPAKGVYLSKYSDYLHPRPWYHGKSGYIVIFRIIKKKKRKKLHCPCPVRNTVQKSTANKTNFTNPSPGFDCHVAINSSKVSPATSHFQAFELTQYYMYDSDITAQRPRQVCPYATVSFQYNEPKCIMSTFERKEM